VEPSSAPWRYLEPAEPGAAARGDPPRRERAVPWPAIGAGAAILALAIGVFVLVSRPGPVVGVEGAASFTGGSTEPGHAAGTLASGGPEIVVEVGGAVARPGVYRLPIGARVADAIAAAGGYGARVDAAAADVQLNLAAILHDADKVRVPVRGETTGGTGAGPGAWSGGASSPPGGPLDLNTAAAAELDTLPGIGPATAAKIIAARTQARFTSVDDLLSRKVLSSAALEKIRALVTAGP
jgi:competence protein ComEA